MKTVKKSAAKKMVKKAAPKMPMQAPQQEAPMMKMGGKMPKANFGKALANMGANTSRKLLPGIIDKNASNEMFGLNKPAAPANSMMKKGGTMKKAKSGTSLGMKSVNDGYDKNPGVTKADFVAIGKSKSKDGAKMKMGGKMKKCKMGCY